MTKLALWEVEFPLPSAGRESRFVDDAMLDVMLSQHNKRDLVITMVAQVVPDGRFFKVVDEQDQWMCKGGYGACADFIRRQLHSLKTPPPPPERSSQKHPEWRCEKHPEAEHQRHPMGVTYCRACHPQMWERCNCNAPLYRCCC